MRVTAVEGGPRLPVYNLNVEGEHEFFANGVLVHNCNWCGLPGEPSPDRMDALVWAVSELMAAPWAGPKRKRVMKWPG